MISLEQVKLLESKVDKAIEYVERVTEENAALRQKETELQVKLDSYQKRINELDALVLRFKEDQSRIEDGILSALDRLNQFEDAIEKSIGGKQGGKAANSKPAAKTPVKAAPKPQLSPVSQSSSILQPEVSKEGDTSAEGIFFEIPQAGPLVTSTDRNEVKGSSLLESGEDPLEALPSLGEPPSSETDMPSEGGELDIF